MVPCISVAYLTVIFVVSADTQAQAPLLPHPAQHLHEYAMKILELELCKASHPFPSLPSTTKHNDTFLSISPQHSHHLIITAT